MQLPNVSDAEFAASQARNLEKEVGCEVLDERGDGEGAFLRIRSAGEAVKGLCERRGQAR